MMKNEMATTSDVELAKMETEIKQRASSIETNNGKKESQQWVLVMFDYLKNSGYKVQDNDMKRMAEAYAGQLKDAIVVYGYNAISVCVREWIKEDKYGRFPNAGQILEKVHELCGNPIAEIAKRNHEAKVKMIVQKEQDELRSKYSKEQIEELERRYTR